MPDVMQTPSAYQKRIMLDNIILQQVSTSE